ncbi:hypothetical protein Tco_1039682 [Tanacetum coccineum]
MATSVRRLINRWWEVPDMEIDSYATWKGWIVTIRMASKTKLMFEGVYYVMWWLLWWYRNKKIFEGKSLIKYKQLKKHVDYEQLINVLAMDKSRLEEELRATQSKMKLYDSVMFGMQMVKFGCCKCKQIVNTLVAASASKWVSNLQMLACKCKLQLQAANASFNSSCNIYAAIQSCKYKL